MQDSWEVYAKILSQEGVTIEYSEYAKTAYYNTQTNVVTIPTFDFLTESATQLMVSHEIGHAMFSKYTLEEFNINTKKFSDIFNVVEDAFIERSIKNRYPGLASIFTEGYSDLARAKFFEYENDYNLIDRLNIYSKMPHVWDIPFYGPTENEFAIRITKLNSKEDVLALCQDIIDYIKNNPEQNDKSETKNEDSENPSDNENSEENKSMDNEDSGGESEETQSDASEGSAGKTQSEKKKEKSQTVCRSQRNFEEKAEEYGEEKSKTVSSGSSILKLDSEYTYKEYFMNLSHLMKKLPQLKMRNSEVFVKSIKDVAKHADIIFKQRKSAWENRETKRRTVGKLDVKKLSKHRTSMDVFRTNITLPEGKNHGVVILIDYSGSMYSSGVLPMVICQAAVVGEFCRMNDIPFEIIAFGITEHTYSHVKSGVAKLCDSLTFDVEGFIRYSEDISLGRYDKISCHDTPTIEGLICAERTIRKFKESGIEKTSLFIITDGMHNNFVTDKNGNGHYIMDDRKIVIDNAFYSAEKTIKRPLSHFDWAVELTCGWIKKLHGTYISLTFLDSIDNVKNMSWDKLVEYAGMTSQKSNPDRGFYDDCYYLFKLFYYFEKKRAKIIDTSQTGLLTCNFNNNPYMDQVQILDIMESTKTTSFPHLSGKIFDFDIFDMMKKAKTMKIFVQKFIEKIS